MDKPPLGLRPRYIVIQHRIREILEAVDRYNDALYIIPQEWLDELCDLSEEQREMRDGGGFSN